MENKNQKNTQSMWIPTCLSYSSTSKNICCFLHYFPVTIFNVYHGMCNHWSWFPSIPQHFHIPPSPLPSSSILHIFLILLPWSMLLHKPSFHTLHHKSTIYLLHLIVMQSPTNIYENTWHGPCSDIFLVRLSPFEKLDTWVSPFHIHFYLSKYSK